MQVAGIEERKPRARLPNANSRRKPEEPIAAADTEAQRRKRGVFAGRDRDASVGSARVVLGGQTSPRLAENSVL